MPAQMAKCEMVKIHKAVELSDSKTNLQDQPGRPGIGPILQHFTHLNWFSRSCRSMSFCI